MNASPPWAKIAGVLFAILIATMLVLAVGGLAVNVWNANKAAKAAIAEAKAGVVVAQGGAAAATDAVGIADTGRQRDERVVTIQRENAHDLQTSPGANAPLDDELVRRSARGMCRYASASGDPGCAEVRPADPALVP